MKNSQESGDLGWSSEQDNPLTTRLFGLQEQLNQWVILAIEGDARAFEELYRAYVKNIYRYFLYKVTTPTEAEDLTAQVFLKAWQAIGSYKVTGSPFLAWLYRIAHNELANYYRSQKQRQSNEILGQTRNGQSDQANHSWEDNTGNSELLETIIDMSIESDPQRGILLKTQKELLYQALNSLPQAYQQVIYFRFMEGWSHAQIAALLDKNESTVRGIQYRALEALGKLLDKESVFGD